MYSQLLLAGHIYIICIHSYCWLDIFILYVFTVIVGYTYLYYMYLQLLLARHIYIICIYSYCWLDIFILYVFTVIVG
jgi:hypothetical protein